MALLLRLVYLLPLLLVAGCSNLFFLPEKEWRQTPAQQQLAYEDVLLVHKNGVRIHGWWLPARGTSKGTVYFLHGNAENVSTHVMAVAWLPSRGYNVFLLDYRGYGASEGKPSLSAAMDDIQLGLEWLRHSGKQEGPLIVYGQSLGAAMSAVVLAQDYNRDAYQCAVLEASFTRYRDIAAHLMQQSWLRILQPVVLPTMPKRWAPEDQVAHIHAPLLVVHSENDEIIPYEQGLRLYAAAQEPKALLTLTAAHIGGTFTGVKQQGLLDFWQQHCQ